MKIGGRSSVVIFAKTGVNIDVLFEGSFVEGIECSLEKFAGLGGDGSGSGMRNEKLIC